MFNALKRSIQRNRRYAARIPVARLVSKEEGRLRVVGSALQEALSGTVFLEEIARIKEIEQRRASLLESAEELVMIDYGAGSPGADRTNDQMAKGVESRVTVSDMCKASKSAFWSLVLFKLLRVLKPSSCVELGSCVGISASYLASALTLNGAGSLATLEGSPETARIAGETLELLGLDNAHVVVGRFSDTLEDVLAAGRPVDFLFNDGHHDHEAVIGYFHQTLPYLSDEALLVFDDISWSRGMRRAWLEIQNHERVGASIDLGKMGLALTGSVPTTRERRRIAL